MERPDHNLIRLGVSPHWHNKTNRAPERRNKLSGELSNLYAQSEFPTQALSVDRVADLVLSGKKISVGSYRRGWVKEANFISAQLVGVDLDQGPDVATAATLPLAEHAFLIHATPSSTPQQPRTRLLFALDAPITSVEVYRRLVKRLLAHFAQRVDGVDMSCKDAARRFSGCANAEHLRRSSAVLTLETLEALPLHPDEIPRPEARLPRRAITGSRAEKYAAAAVEGVLRDYYSTPAGVGQRHAAFVKTVARLIGMRKGGWPGLESIEIDIHEAGRATERPSREIADAIQWAEANAEPIALELPADAPRTRQLRVVTPADYVKRQIKPLTLRQAGRYMIVCPEYVLIELHTLAMGCPDAFAVNQLAASIGCSLDKAQRLIDAALQHGAVSERSAEKIRIDQGEESIVINSAERQMRGAAKARHYCLTPDRADVGGSTLRDHVQELMEWGEPDVIRKDEALEASLGDQDAERLETVTSEVARSDAADVVTANAERAAQRKADELTWLADTDDTPFTPEHLPGSVAQLRVLLLEALIETDLDANWTHSVLMWIVGVKRSSIGALVRKSKFAPSPNSTFVPVPVEGKDIHRAVSAQCREKRGAPVAWLDAQGEVLQSFTRRVPDGAAGVLLNVGKKYIRRDSPSASADWTECTPKKERPAAPDPTPAEAAEQEQSRAEKRAQREMLPRMRGCMKARGWKFIPGPFGYWERVDASRHVQTCANTWEGMVEALLDDYTWARDTRAQRRAIHDPLLIAAGSEFGAEVMAL